MQNQYRPEEIEPYVQRAWEQNKTFQVQEEEGKEKFYCLSMPPYPSGHLHMGHVRNYTIGDVIARYQRMKGKNVLHPMGWDAFGLPAETAAINNNTVPASWTYSNINYMKKQLKLLGFSYDWSRELVTCNPEYYRWEQWFFTKLYNKGLVYKKLSFVNWCPTDQTVLANEQVIDGCCWRCDTRVSLRKVPQWFIRITSYAEELLHGLDHLEFWPDQVKNMQRNWIGRSEGVEITFSLVGYENKITIYTTRPDTIMGISCLAIALEHPLAVKAAVLNPTLCNFIRKYGCVKYPQNERDNSETIVGMSTDLFAIHPLTRQKLPIWVVNFISLEYGTGGVMIVPAHDHRDWEFANKYNLPMKSVLLAADGTPPDVSRRAMTERGTLFNSGEFSGLSNEIGSNIITTTLINKGAGKRAVHYRLRDWGVSRQRYWGAPIPMITLEDGSIIPVSENKLPVILPENVIVDGITSPLKNDKWGQTLVQGKKAVRETDTFDTFMESSWYYARYTCPHYKKGILDPYAANYWLPIDQYIGGIEHAILHLMYFRFYHKLLRDAGLVQTDEPAKRLLCQGMVLTDTFYYIGNNQERVWIDPLHVTSKRDEKGRIVKAQDRVGRELVYAGISKMSKSKNNGIDPHLMIEKYGADTIRLFIMFAAPSELPLQWSNSGIEGCRRFLKRLWYLVYKHTQKRQIDFLDHKTPLNELQSSLRRKLHQTIAKVTDDIDRRQTYNTAIAAIMKFINYLSQFSPEHSQDRSLMQESLLAVIRMLYPFTPHICFVLWQAIHNFRKNLDIDHAQWPQVDKEALKENTWLIVVQVNGKVRGRLMIPNHFNEKQIHQQATRDPQISKYLKGLTIRQVFYVPGKLINLILSSGK
ncbi:MAG: leucine--tRNA ligase [Candidatus Dasytiphilus stammeri]